MKRVIRHCISCSRHSFPRVRHTRHASCARGAARAGRVRVTAAPASPSAARFPMSSSVPAPVVRVAPRVYLGAVAFTAVALATLPPANVRVWSASEESRPRRRLDRRHDGHRPPRHASAARGRQRTGANQLRRSRLRERRGPGRRLQRQGSTSRACIHSSISRTAAKSITCASSPKPSATRPPFACIWCVDATSRRAARPERRASRWVE